MSNITSTKIKVFPTVNRSDIVDRNARLYTEQNIILPYKTITDKDSFIVSNSLVLDYSGSKLIISGDFIIGGYYFNLNEVNTGIDSSQSSEKSLYLAIQLNSDLLQGTDSGSNYNGVAIIFSASEPSSSTYDAFLKVATYNSGWVKEYSPKLSSSSIGIKLTSDVEAIQKNYIQGSTKDLQTFFEDLIIDDGTI